MNLLPSVGRRLTLFLCCLVPLTPISAQDTSPAETDPELILQEIFPVIPEDIDPEELFEHFSQLLNDPLDLNLMTPEQLRSTMIPGERQITSFFEHRQKAGRFISIYELQAIPEWDLATIKRLAPFLTVTEKTVSLKKSLGSPTQHFLLARARRTLEKQKGYTAPDRPGASRYAGNPYHLYLRYRYARTGVFSTGVSLEKDAGEVWRWSPARQVYGVDFTSFHIQLLNRGRLKNLILGDFQVQFGQGLVLSSGLSLGKSAEVIQISGRSSTGIRPYTSAIEHRFFRGAAATIELTRRLHYTVFVSLRRTDATLSEKNGTVITSFPTDGYHRTTSERNKQGNVAERNSGSQLVYHSGKIPLQLGITTLFTGYSLPVEKRDLPYNRFEFKGRNNLIVGLHGTYRLKNQHFFAESARSYSGGTGTVTGAIIALNKHWDAALLYRHYRHNFHTIYGNAFKEGSRPINEKGLYGGIRFAPSGKWRHSAYLDLFRFPRRKYLVDTASGGNGFLLHTLWKPRKTFRAYASFQRERKQKNNKGADVPALPLAKTIRNTAAISLDWSKPMRYTLRTRLQGVRYRFGEQAPSLGFALIQDASIRLRGFEISGRFAFFRTDDYDSRQYAFERDVRYAFSLPSYYDHGTRHYLMVRYQVFRAAQVWLRWSQTRYNRLNTVGSGLDESGGNTRSEAKFQIMYQL